MVTRSLERTTSQILRTSRAEARAVDWDATVRQAFLEGCVQQGVRAAMARRALADTKDAGTIRVLRETAEDAGRRAAVSWLTIETSLEQYGELAAFAFERCIEEAALQIRRRSYAPGSSVRAPSQLDRDDAALAIVERARERLARFWASSDTSAA
jgi:hypothetical protein